MRARMSVGMAEILLPLGEAACFGAAQIGGDCRDAVAVRAVASAASACVNAVDGF